MNILIFLLIVAVVVGLLVWLGSIIPYPPQLVFLRWLIPLIVVIAALLYLLPKLGIS